MKILIIIFLLCSKICFSQNTFKEISQNRRKISIFLFKEILDKNTFNNSITTHVIFKNNDITLYYISTFSPHACINVGIFSTKKIELIELKEKDNIKELLYILNNRYNLNQDNLCYIKNKLSAYWKN